MDDLQNQMFLWFEIALEFSLERVTNAFRRQVGEAVGRTAVAGIQVDGHSCSTNDPHDGIFNENIVGSRVDAEG